MTSVRVRERTIQRVEDAKEKRHEHEQGVVLTHDAVDLIEHSARIVHADSRAPGERKPLPHVPSLQRWRTSGRMCLKANKRWRGREES